MNNTANTASMPDLSETEFDMCSPSGDIHFSMEGHRLAMAPMAWIRKMGGGLAIVIASATNSPYGFFGFSGAESTSTRPYVAIMKRRKISVFEARNIALGILFQAETRRVEFAEREAKEAIMWENE